MEEVVLSFEPSEEGDFRVRFNDSEVGVLQVPNELRGIRELRFSELDRLGEVLGRALCTQCDRLVTLLKAVSHSSRLVLEFRKGSEGLLGLPWEFVKHPDSGSPLSLEMPFVRRIGKAVELKPIDGRPLKVLVVISECLALERFDARRFHDVICEEARELVDDGLLQLEFLSLPCTPDVLARRVLKDCPDVVHFIGHGNVGVLAFEDDGGDLLNVGAERFNVFFKNGNLRLVILTACFSGALGGTDLVSGTATAIVQADVPAVLAMQLPIEVESAYRLVGDLYAVLLREPFDLAVRRLRAMRFFAERLHTPAQWGIPVLYLQDGGENLFNGVSKGEGLLKCWPPLSPSFELPVRPELFVGRKDLLPKVNWALVDNKIVFLHGLSGMGKSFLARELCNWHKARGSFPGGIIWLDIGAELSYAMVLEKIGSALKVRDLSEESIRCGLAAEPALLVLDSYERVVSEPDFARFLQNLPDRVRVLLTTTEWVTMGRTIQVGEMNESDAVELFYRRAKQEGWDETGKENIFDICKELGFVPLFIELVAPRAASIPLDNLLKEVSGKLSAIAAERPDLPERQRTAEAAFRFSYDPLEPQEKLLFAVMSVFYGHVFPETISRIADASKEDTLRILEKLHKKGLVIFEGQRYRLHHTVCRFASDRLEKEFNMKQEYEEKFATQFLSYAVWGGQALETEDARTAVNMTQLELPNFIGAQRWFFDRKKFDDCHTLSNVLNFLLERTGFWRTRVETAAIGRKAAEHEGDREMVAVSIHNLALAYYTIGNLDEAEKHFKESLKIKREIGDKELISSSTHHLGMIERDRGNLDEAEKHFKESLEIAREIGNKGIIAASTQQLGMIERDRGNLDEAEEHFKESLEIAREIGFRQGIALSMAALGTTFEKKGLFENGLRQFLKAALLFSQVNSPHEETALNDIVRMVEKVSVQRFKEMLTEEVEEVRNYIKRRFPTL